ncbi:MAG: hypothetical protein R2877_00800 [Bdellovibrionota bacterium]
MDRKHIWISGWLAIALAACGSEKVQENTNQLPARSAFLIKANVTGLNGTLVISNRGENNVTIDQNGEVSMPGTWVQGSSYEVKVMSEPCAQRCEIDQPKGDVKTSGSVTLNISCASKHWETVLQEDHISLQNSEAYSPSMSMNTYGDLLVGWVQSNDYNAQVYKREFFNRKWSETPAIVDHVSFAGSESLDVEVNLNDQMEATLSWGQDNTDGFRSLYIADRVDSDWQLPSNIDDKFNVAGISADSITAAPKVKTNAVGEKVAVWAQLIGPNVKLFKAEFLNGQWVKPTSIADRISLDGSDVKSYDVAINDLGEVIVVWAQSNGTNEQIFKAEKRNGVWNIPTNLGNNISPSSTDSKSPKVTMNNAGEAYIVWHQHDSTGASAKYRVYLSETHDYGVTWNHPSGLSNGFTPSGKDSIYPRVTVNDQGKIIVVYQYKQNNGENQVYYREKTSFTAPWSSNASLSTEDFSEAQGRVALDIDQLGNVIVAWSSNPSGKVYKAEKRNGAWVLANPDVPLSFAASVYNTPAVVASTCRSAIAWQQSNGSNFKQVYVRQYR